jgi:hypothetical protein
MKQTEKNNKKGIAIIQVIVLILGIIAFAYILGSEIKIVKADGMDIIEEAPVNEIPTGRDISGLIADSVKKFAMPAVVIKSLPTTTATATETAATTETGWLGKILTKAGLNEGVAVGMESILSSAAYAAGTYMAVKWIATALKIQPGGAKALAAGAAAGIFIGTGANTISQLLGFGAIPGLGWIAAGIGTLVTLLTWKSEKEDKVVFTCGLWQPESGGKNCEKCNDGIFPCSEYQCASLGVSCQIINKGTKDQKCVWVDRNDVDVPVISPLLSALKSGYSYSDNKAVSPPDRGVKIQFDSSSDKCIPPYKSFSFGINVSQNAKCRVDIERKNNFSAMEIPLDGERYLKEHTITMALPNTEDLEAENVVIVGTNGNEHKLHIRCVGGNGIESNADFEFSYCIQSGPDLNPPEIIETSILNNSPVSFGVGSVDLTVSVDKPSQCKWSILDRSYEDMENTMSCSTISQANAKGLYNCKTTLTGIKDRENNNFYFRCKGTYNEKTNPVSYLFILKGTQPLVITDTGPNGTIKDSTEVVKVTLTAKTTAGYDSGKATCHYSKTGEEGTYITFYNTDSYTHTQPLSLAEGDYFYYIRCIDAGGNSDNKTISFTVESDSDAPAVVRAFHDSNYLKIITNEDAECVYNYQDAIGCNYDFDDGITMTTLKENEHYTDWNTLLNFYIKCRDEYGNQPAPNKCSITIRPFAL